MSPDLLAIVVLVVALLSAARTLRHIFSVGMGANDVMVALVVMGCLAIYPVLALGARSAGALNVGLCLALVAGLLSILGLFSALARREELQAGLPLVWLSQLALSFSLWTGLLLLLRAVPLALRATAAELAWPGAWLWGPVLLSGLGIVHTIRAHDRVRVERLRGPDTLARPLRVVHLSDLHASPVTPGATLRASIAKVNALEPDLVLITGDLVIPFSEASHAYLLDALAGLRAPTFHCAGNHDLPVIERLHTELAALGQPLLEGEQRLVRCGDLPVEVVGAPFAWGPAEPQVEGLLAACPPLPGARLRLLLAHDPRLFRAVPAGRFDLVLSGHTHGGHLGAELLGLAGSPLRWLGLYDAGLFQREGALLNVSRGGWQLGFPPRMGVGGELVLLLFSPEHPAAPAGARPAEGRAGPDGPRGPLARAGQSA